MDKSALAQACSALKAAQTTLSEGLNRLRVASAARPPEPLGGEGEFVALDQVFSRPGGRPVGSFLSRGVGVGWSDHPPVRIYAGFLLSPPKPGGTGD